MLKHIFYFYLFSFKLHHATNQQKDREMKPTPGPIRQHHSTAVSATRTINLERKVKRLESEKAALLEALESVASHFGERAHRYGCGCSGVADYGEDSCGITKKKVLAAIALATPITEEPYMGHDGSIAIPPKPYSRG